MLDLSGQTRGWYFGLLNLVGLASTPILGHLSDRFGRKVVLMLLPLRRPGYSAEA